MATARAHSPQFACGGLMSHAKHSHPKKVALPKGALLLKQGCAVRQVPIDMWEWVWERADEARRRRSWAKTKEGLGSEVLRKHQSPPSCTSGSTAAAPRMKRVYRGKERRGV